MKIVVLNGSPKGMTSVTMQYVLFLRKKFPEHQFAIWNVAQDLPKLEAEPESLARVIADVESADAVLWAFPLYYFLVHAYYKRFIELLFDRGAQSSFQDKYAAVLSTSIHILDYTAHNYMSAICDDLGMHYLGGYSAAMYDLLKEEERQRFLLFARGVLAAIEHRATVPRRYEPLRPVTLAYSPGPAPAPLAASGKKIVLLTDARKQDANLRAMIARFTHSVADPVEIIDLHKLTIRGGCMGCIQCGQNNVCVYRDHDDIHAVYRKLMAADVLVLALTIRDRYLSSRWKLFLDRGFFMNHVPILVGKQLACLLSGPLRQIANLRQILEAYIELQRANLAGIVTDEAADSAELDHLLDSLARNLLDCAVSGTIAAPTFFSAAGSKLMRDELWAHLRVAFPADHRYYKRHGVYDFPRRSVATTAMHALMALLLKVPSFNREFRKRIRTEMIKPLEKMVEKV
jgi:multimeric flavodoxin WrbA